MARFDVLPRNPVSSLSPFPTAESNQTPQPVPAIMGGGFGPIEGRPPGPIWAHQQFEDASKATSAKVATVKRFIADSRG